MTVIDEVRARIKEADRQLRDDYLDVVDFQVGLSDLLSRACSEGAECDSSNESKRKQGEDAYRSAAVFFQERGFPVAAENLLIRWWNEISKRQLLERFHVYRAMTAFELCKLYLAQNDFGAALRWALLTHADDRLHEHPEGGGAGMQYLRTILGANQADLEAINRIADENLGIIRSADMPDDKAAWFPEDVVVRLALEGLSVAHLFSRPSLRPEFPISSSYLQTLLGRVDAQGISASEKGKALEKLASYLFLLIPGWFPSRNHRDEEDVYENDLVVSNLNPQGNLAAELLGRYFLVECKNWKDNVPLADIGYFFHRMRLTHCSFGILFAKSGVTGNTEKDNAGRGAIRRSYHEDRNLCIVLGKEELDKLERRETTLWTMLMDVIQRFRFGKPR